MNRNPDGSYVRRVSIDGEGEPASPLQSDIATARAYQVRPASENTGQAGQVGDAVAGALGPPMYGAASKARARETWGNALVTPGACQLIGNLLGVDGHDGCRQA